MFKFLGVLQQLSSLFALGWRKPKSDHEEDSPSDSGILDRRESKSETVFHRGGVKGKMSFKTASQATLTFLSARKRIEGGLKNLGKKMSKHDVFKGEENFCYVMGWDWIRVSCIPDRDFHEPDWGLEMSSYMKGYKTTLVHDVSMTVLTSWHHFHVSFHQTFRRQCIREEWNWTYFQWKNIVILA